MQFSDFDTNFKIINFPDRIELDILESCQIHQYHKRKGEIVSDLNSFQYFRKQKNIKYSYSLE